MISDRWDDLLRLVATIKESTSKAANVANYFKAENPKGFTGRMAAVLTAYVQAHQPK